MTERGITNIFCVTREGGIAQEGVGIVYLR